MLVLDEIAFSYTGMPAYHFTMEARPGEITVVRGASGSGKSTLLDLIAGFLTPVSGTISIAGKIVNALPPEDRPVSILFQTETLFEHLSAGRNVALGLKQADVQQVENALKELGLVGISNQRASTLSGGQKQRVALARTLLRNRPVLLLDEPFSALDDETRAISRDLVKSLVRKQQWATVLVTHHPADIEAVADRIYDLKDGRLTG